MADILPLLWEGTAVFLEVIRNPTVVMGKSHIRKIKYVIFMSGIDLA